MGLFDFLRGKKDEPQQQEFEEKKRDSIKVYRNLEGNPRIQYVEANKSRIVDSDYYDTTQLTINRRNDSIPTNGQPIYDCSIFWYDSDNTIMLDENGRETGSEDIQVGLDMDSITSGDTMYIKALMLQLLNRNRVMEDYLKRGMQDNPQTPCGNYVGSIERTEQGFKKRFYGDIGRISHQMYQPVRDQMKAERENERQYRIERNNRDIEKYNQMVNDLKEKNSRLMNPEDMDM